VIDGNTYINFYTVKVNVVKASFMKVPWYLIHPFGRPCFLFASYSVVLEKLFYIFISYSQLLATLCYKTLSV